MTKITKYTITVSVILFVTSFFLGKESSENILLIFEQPFVFIGKQLRSMSLSGGFGNLIAIVFYVFISSIPLWILGYFFFKKKVIKVDYILLPILSIALFMVIYLMINQNLVIEMLPPVLAIPVIDGDLAALRIYNVGIIMTFYTLLLLYLFARYFIFKKVSIYKLVNVILYLLIFTILLKTILIDTSILMNSETSNHYDTAQEILNYFFKLASTAIIVFILINFQLLSKHLELKVIDTNLFQLTKMISKFSLISIFVIISQYLVINLYQIAFSSEMYNIGFILSVPIFELLLVMIMLLITEYMKRTYDIYEENALTI